MESAGVLRENFMVVKYLNAPALFSKMKGEEYAVWLF
jgi:hypothetical protein